MAANTVISNAAVIAGLNTITALSNVGGTGAVKIFSGAAPASCETADSGTLLVTFALVNPAFPTAVDNSAGGATATATLTGGIVATATASAGAPTTAGYFRAYPHVPSTTNAWNQGTVGTSAADMIINTTSITAGDTITITAWTITFPDGSTSD